MSELIEKLEELKRHLRPYGDDTASSMIRLSTEGANAILSALRDQKTLRGIEGLAKNHRVLIHAGTGINIGEYCVRYDYRDHYGTTLSAAVEAARAGK